MKVKNRVKAWAGLPPFAAEDAVGTITSVDGGGFVTVTLDNGTVVTKVDESLLDLDETPKPYTAMTDHEYLRNLADRLWKIPVMYGTDQYDAERLREIAQGLDNDELVRDMGCRL